MSISTVLILGLFTLPVGYFGFLGYLSWITTRGPATTQARQPAAPVAQPAAPAQPVMIVLPPIAAPQALPYTPDLTPEVLAAWIAARGQLPPGGAR